MSEQPMTDDCKHAVLETLAASHIPVLVVIYEENCGQIHIKSPIEKAQITFIVHTDTLKIHFFAEDVERICVESMATITIRATKKKQEEQCQTQTI